jgi:transposase
MDINSSKDRLQRLLPFLDERLRRLVAAAEAQSLGYGGISAVSIVTGLSRRAISQGIAELDNPAGREPKSRIRKPGGGRKRKVDKDPELIRALESLIISRSRPETYRPLEWTCKGVRRLADELKSDGHSASHQLVSDLLKELGFSLLGNPKIADAGMHPDRAAQFEYINQIVVKFHEQQSPVIWLQAKKKALDGTLHRGGFEYCPQGDVEQSCVHDCLAPELCAIGPASEITSSEGWGASGIDKDTSVICVNAISSWWHAMGGPDFPGVNSLLIAVDGGGSNSYRVRLWKSELQRFANETGLTITICHLPPGTCKWSRVEHRLYSFVTQCRKGKPQCSYEAIINMVASDNTKAKSNTNRSRLAATAVRRPLHQEADAAKINIRSHTFHGEWNYTIAPFDRN